MAANRLLPGVDEINRLLQRGETRTSIAKQYGVNRTAVSLALTRAGQEPGQVRHENLLPWRIKRDHLSDYNARMLRLEGRLRAGLKITASDAARHASWRRDLKDKDDAVIMYFPEHDCTHCKGAGGFHPVRRADARRLYGEPSKRYDTKLIFVTKDQERELRRSGGHEG